MLDVEAGVIVTSSPVFENVPEHEHPRIKKGLKACLESRLDSRISVIHGNAGVGKSTGLTILHNIMNKHESYALTLELSQLLTDHFIKAKVKNKTYFLTGWVFFNNTKEAG